MALDRCEICFLRRSRCEVTIQGSIDGPPIIVEHTQRASELSIPNGQLSTGPFNIDTGIVSTFNQQLWLLCQIKLNGTKAGSSFTDNFHLSVEIFGRAKDSSYHLIATTPLTGPAYCAARRFEKLQCRLHSGGNMVQICFSCAHIHGNDPLFPLNFLVNSWVPSMFDSVFQASFLCALLLFWLCAFHGIRQSERRLSFYLPKILIVGLLWVAAFTLSSWQQYNELQDPTYQYKIDIGHFMGLKVLFFTIGAIYLVYLVYLLFRAYSELRAMPYFDVRLKFLTGLMLIVLTISLVITGLRFGTGVLQDNFVAELETHYDNYILYFFDRFNTQKLKNNGLVESYFRDQSTFSMLNESEDEDTMIYNTQREKSNFSSSEEEN
ncbi:hypothetical protein OS493_018450 [Desmophyllum pertusum]|uniref:Transmembrane protein 181 n=1 Tax=Desmophyllum pertusum TaxID=174260 RepID=A0A9X0D9E9_9CNID|nr:hypothetical protein OS493_018450 [Desmophyllum pertusum]